ncbi:YdeI/OmpD-associated family protein [Sphingomonas sp.]|jgi:uncharacterized protein YdeI (YjbR/CyaY-like superfamily)|uniref:YdeI/OmpD-associated family protein n=1 Tax=Sphingomonas sp. TaxID=28214 RepID=UPI002E313F38|nr:YdeI/OmpD-associated family protein [Sphingomonas sp.]HEX4694948.1 YdeI/OmpD-associated family protein [Sphingomonas sp.]
MSTDPRIDAYIAGKPEFARPILDHIRARLHAACPEVEESIKWSMPAFLYRGRPLANMAAFKAHASFGFWDRSALLSAGEFADVAARGRDGMGLYGKLTSIADLPDDATFEAQIRQAVAYAERDDRPKRAARQAKPEAEVPAALAEALAGDDAAKAIWEAFSPSCRREYCEWVAGAKRDETRAKRVATTVEQLRAGKKLNWKYENC